MMVHLFATAMSMAQPEQSREAVAPLRRNGGIVEAEDPPPVPLP